MSDDLPPHDLNAEKAALGACLLDPEAVDAVADVIGPDDFYRPAHSTLFGTILDVRDGGRPVDAVTILAELGRNGHLAQVGGAPYLHTLMESVPTASNAGYYAEQVSDRAVRRRLLEAGQRAQQLALASGDTAEIVERVRAAVEGVSDKGRSGVGLSAVGDLAAVALIRYGQPSVSGLSTPWTDLTDCFNGGLRPGTLTVVGARPGSGKSIAGMQCCVHAAQNGLGALLISLEMPEAELTDRIVSSMSATNYSRILRHDLEDSDWSRVQLVVDKLADLPLLIVDKPYLTLSAIRAIARSVARTAHGLALLVVDYIQLMAPADPKAPREQQVAAMSRGLKLLAKELGIAVIALAQLNRAGASRADKRPTLTDLRESGSIEQDADHVLLLSIPDDEARIGEIDMIVAKNRGGSTNTITAAWAPHYQSIRCLARGYDR